MILDILKHGLLATIFIGTNIQTPFAAIGGNGKNASEKADELERRAAEAEKSDPEKAAALREKAKAKHEKHAQRQAEKHKAKNSKA